MILSDSDAPTPTDVVHLDGVLGLQAAASESRAALCARSFTPPLLHRVS